MVVPEPVGRNDEQAAAFAVIEHARFRNLLVLRTVLVSELKRPAYTEGGTKGAGRAHDVF
jgi:hypothetical protein